jgi:hypothetical protein
MGVVLDDTFFGTSGANLTGSAPNLVQNGFDVWGDISSLGLGTFQYVSGGGIRTTSFGSSNTSANTYPLTGVGPDQLASLTWVNSGSFSSNVLMQLRRNPAGTEAIHVSINYTNQQIVLLKIIGGSATILVDTGVYLVAGVTYTATLQISGSGSLASVTLNGSPVAAMSNVSIPTLTGTGLLFGQDTTANTVLFTRAKVAVPPYTGLFPWFQDPALSGGFTPDVGI